MMQGHGTLPCPRVRRCYAACEKRRPVRLALCALSNRRTNKISPFCPRSVIVADIREIEQIFEREPRVRRALSDAAVRDHVFFAANAFAAVNLLKFLDGLKSAILGNCL